MPRDKTETHRRILASAEEEFFKEGFEKASMRKIAEKAGVTAGALYRHFATKEEMFSALVEPMLEKLYGRQRSMMEEALRETEQGNLRSFQEISEAGVRETLAFFYECFDRFFLLFHRSAGTRYEHLRREFVKTEVEQTKQLIAVLRGAGVPVREFSDEQLYLLYGMVFAPLFEIIARRYSREQAESCTEILTDAMNFGWRKIFAADGDSVTRAS